MKTGRVPGWDLRDYELWSAIMNLPSYGLIADDKNNPMLSRKEVLELLRNAARVRMEQERAK